MFEQFLPEPQSAARGGDPPQPWIQADSVHLCVGGSIFNTYT